MTFAQKKRGQHLVNVFFTAQNYFDKQGISRDLTSAENSLQAKNTVGYSFCLQYERITHYGLIFGGGLQYGKRKYSLSIYQDMSAFDPNASDNLKGAFFSDNINVNTAYLGIKLFTGYKLKLNNRISAIIRGGIVAKYVYKGLWENPAYTVRYFYDDGTAEMTSEFIFLEKKFGKNPVYKSLFGANRFPQGVFELYAGIERNIRGKLVKNLSIGIEGTRLLWTWVPEGEMQMRYITSVYQQRLNKSVFNDLNLSIGLRIGIGLWK